MVYQTLFPMTKIILYSVHLENTFISKGKRNKQTVVEHLLEIIIGTEFSVVDNSRIRK